MNFRYPIFLDLTGKKCLVTGEHAEIPEKIRALIAVSAEVLYVSAQASAEIAEMARVGSIRWERRDFRAEDLENCLLVIASLHNNSEIFRLAEEQRILCNAIDDPKHCRFSFGSVHRQGDLTVAISTNGWAPALAVRLKEKMQREIGPEYGALLTLLKQVRPEITSRIPEFSARRDLWYRLVDSDLLKMLREGQNEMAAEKLRRMMDEFLNSTSRSDTSGDDAGR